MFRLLAKKIPKSLWEPKIVRTFAPAFGQKMPGR
jgi:hypothetical protein